MVPDPRDGVGVWRCSTDPGMSVIVNANTLTLETLIDLCEGKYGAGPTCPDHIVIALNCSWGTGDDVGQFWQRCVSHCPYLDVCNCPDAWLVLLSYAPEQRFVSIMPGDL
jgi:hypothetical protein